MIAASSEAASICADSVLLFGTRSDNKMGVSYEISVPALATNRSLKE